MMPATVKTELPIVPIFATYTKGSHLRGAPSQFGASGELAEKLDLSTTIVMDYEGLLYEGRVFIQPHVPTFCGGAIAVWPEVRRLPPGGDPSLFPTVPRKHAVAAAMVSAIAYGQQHWGRYMAALFGPYDTGHHIGRMVSHSRPMFREHVPVVHVMGHSPVERSGDLHYLNGIGNRYSFSGHHTALRTQFAVGRRHENPNSGNACVSVTLTNSPYSVRSSSMHIEATNEQIAALYDHIATTSSDVLPKLRRESTGEVKW